MLLMKLAFYFALTLGVVPSLCGAIVGTNSAALPLTAKRIAALPKNRLPAWKKYLERSERQLRADQKFFRTEMRKHDVKVSLSPPPGSSRSRLPLNQPAVWYAQAEALRIADIVVSFQTPAGGWSKNLDMTQHPRAPGEQFAAGNTSIYLAKFDNDAPPDIHWNFVGTFDNSATITQLRYLAKVVATVGPDRDASYRTAFLRGIDYILAAQFPNGGWPQIWPVQGGYHDAITFNDDAIIKVLQLLSDLASGQNEFAFVPEPTRKLAAASIQRGIECILETQIIVGGRRTVWCQQHDALTLQPTAARNYEMPSQCGSEGAEIMMFLMRLPNPSPKTVAAVHAAAAWFEKTRLRDVAYKTVGDEGRQLVPSPGSGPLWARYYEIGSDRPIFGDRDKTIHDTVSEISKERRDGYSWFNETPKQALEQYARWSAAHPRH